MTYLPNLCYYYYMFVFLRSLLKDLGYMKVKSLNINVISRSNAKEIISIVNVFVI